MKVIICRRDLPRNPNWKIQGYPYESCWDIDEFFSSKDVPYEEKRRIWFECYWRLRGMYKKGRPFFDVYILEHGELKPLPPEKHNWVCADIIVAGFAYDVVPPEAREQPLRLYRELFGRLYK